MAAARTLSVDHAPTLRAILSNDRVRWRVLGLVRSLRLPDYWIGAGFIRNAVWSHLHRRPAPCLSGDVDVLWFCPERVAGSADKEVEAALRAMEPSVCWSVKNQARMHLRNGDPPYASTLDAMRHWPETATAVATRLTEDGRCELAAPFGLGDLFGLILSPTPRFMGGKHHVYLDRIQSKGWLATWPLLRMDAGASCQHDDTDLNPELRLQTR
ncbi:MAG TPA: nucleotidyltransferase family protein [Acetobacteraceae bacterium]|nr:nucleotidyltransferase family protein [Acetobacteraceae bacterium]